MQKRFLVSLSLVALLAACGTNNPTGPSLEASMGTYHSGNSTYPTLIFRVAPKVSTSFDLTVTGPNGYSKVHPYSPGRTGTYTNWVTDTSTPAAKGDYILSTIIDGEKVSKTITVDSAVSLAAPAIALAEAASRTKVSLKWDAITDAKSYRINLYQRGAAGSTLVKSSGYQTATTAVFDGLTLAAGDYLANIEAFNADLTPFNASALGDSIVFAVPFNAAYGEVLFTVP